MVWCGSMWHIFPWRSRGNQVSKTRFPTPINIENNPEHIRENPEKKKKKNQKNPEHAARCLGFFHPGARRPGHAGPRPHADLGGMLPGFCSPKSHATQVARCLGFFHSDLKPTHPPMAHADTLKPPTPVLIFSLFLFLICFFFFFLGFFPFSDLKGLFSDLVCLFVCYFFPPGSSFSLIFSLGSSPSLM